MATDYQAQLAAETTAAVTADRVSRAKAIYASPVGAWIDKYKGGFPPGYAAAAIQWESDGIATTVGDLSLGEYGYFQVTAEFPTTIGLPSDARLDPETNVFLGLTEYQMESVRQSIANPLVVLGTDDAWKIARLAFAIGSAGTRNLIANANPQVRGKVYDAVVAYVDALGRYDQIWYRVHTTQVVWDIGEQVISFQSWGKPMLPPAPPAGPYYITPDVAMYFGTPVSPLVVGAVVGLAALAWWRYT